MTHWRPQAFLKAGDEAGVDRVILKRAAEAGRRIVAVNPELTPVFTLRHLAHLTSVDYGFLRSMVARTIPDPYRVFAVRKSRVEPKASAFRTICIPDPALMRVQRWIAKSILAHGQPHSASFAYAPRSSIIEAARLHCGCSWLIKLDARNFFESISEISAYRAFRALGYQALISFEMARICTRMDRRHWIYPRMRASEHRRHSITSYRAHLLGHLAQGAPTSPMLSNLCMVDFDNEVESIADRFQLRYSRYADDLCLSSSDRDFGRSAATQAIRELCAAMTRHGLSPNTVKTRICPPGSRKIVLGLLVDQSTPRLTREFRANLRRHIHYLKRKDVGPIAHAKARGFVSLRGMRNHIEGLVSFARQIDPGYANRCAKQLDEVAWPL